MSLLSDISREQDRLKALGLRPIIIMAGHSTLDRLSHERELVFGSTEGKLLGMETRQDLALGDGVIRLMTEYDPQREYYDERPADDYNRRYRARYCGGDYLDSSLE